MDAPQCSHAADSGCSRILPHSGQTASTQHAGSPTPPILPRKSIRLRRDTGTVELRAAEPRDLDQIAALLTVRGEPEDAVDHRLATADGAPCAVVVDGDKVVSTATLLDETL